VLRAAHCYEPMTKSFAHLLDERRDIDRQSHIAMTLSLNVILECDVLVAFDHPADEGDWTPGGLTSSCAG